MTIKIINFIIRISLCLVMAYFDGYVSTAILVDDYLMLSITYNLNDYSTYLFIM